MSDAQQKQFTKTITDPRYSVTQKDSRFILWFCGWYIGSFNNFNELLLGAIFDQGERLGIL